jgi:alkylation response protein AidB-like acyl-CoA dehydrogenase/putative sterol carrier protein
MTSYYFNEEHETFRESLRAFLDREVLPHIDEWEEQGRIPKNLWPKFGEMGYLGLNYPEKYGGMEADFWYSVVFLEEIAKCYSGGFTITPSVQQYMASPYLLKHGSEAIKQKYLTKAISGEYLCSIAITEPGAGSDVANIQTRAERRGDHYVMNGAKTFITNGVYGDVLVTVVKTDPEAGINGISLLVIDRRAEGVSARKLKKLGWHASDTAELNFDEVKVPAENLLGEEGQGFFYLMGGLQLERLAGAISAVAACEHALAYALQYMSEREAFGRPINKFQVLRHRVAQMAAEIESTRAFVYHCCRLHADGQYAVKECSMAKLLATELSDKVTYQCLQFFGGYGYMEEYKIARMFRDSRIGTIGGGTSEIMREIIAKMIIDDKAYSSAGPLPGTRPTNGKANGQAKSSHSQPKNGTIMSVETIFNAIQERANNSSVLGNTLKFDLGGEQIYLDGTGSENTVSREDKDADCTVSVSPEDFESILSGDLNPMNAFMSGKIKVQGDMGVTMKLQGLLG